MARVRDTITVIMKDEGISSAALAKAMGYESFRGVERNVNREGSMRVDTAARMLHFLGYRLLAVPDNIEVEGEGVYWLTE